MSLLHDADCKTEKKTLEETFVASFCAGADSILRELRAQHSGHRIFKAVANYVSTLKNWILYAIALDVFLHSKTHFFYINSGAYLLLLGSVKRRTKNYYLFVSCFLLSFFHVKTLFVFLSFSLAAEIRSKKELEVAAIYKVGCGSLLVYSASSSSGLLSWRLSTTFIWEFPADCRHIWPTTEVLAGFWGSEIRTKALHTWFGGHTINRTENSLPLFTTGTHPCPIRASVRIPC